MSSAGISPGPLTQDDVHTIQTIIINIVVQAVGLGILAILAIMALYTLVCKGLHSSLHGQFLFIAITIIVLSTTITFSSYLDFSIKHITILGPNPMPISKFIIAGSICPRVNYFMSDLIVVWRAWVLSDRRAFRITLVICMLMTLGCMIPEAVFTIRIYFNTAATSEKNPLLDLMMIIPLLTTNVIATSIIAYKIWIYRSENQVQFEQRSQKKIENILVILVESGLVYCAIWILILVTTLAQVSKSFQVMMPILAVFISAIYPVAIILLVNRGKTAGMSSAEEDAVSCSFHFTSTPRSVSQITHSHSII